MKPIKFKEANKNLMAGKHEGHKVEPLWIMTDGQQCVSCWKMTFKQRIQSLFYGKVWLCVLSGDTQPPVWLDCSKTVFKEIDYR